jgi:hypothetical protein
MQSGGGLGCDLNDRAFRAREADNFRPSESALPGQSGHNKKAAAPGRCGFAARRIGRVGQCSWSPSAAEPDEFSDECPHEGAAGVAQLGAAEAGSADGVTVAGFDAGAALRARLAADFFFAGNLLALAFLADFLADFFGAAALDFLADFFADLAFFAVFFADLFEDFFADFFFAVTVLFLPFLAFLPAFFFLLLAIVILLLPPINVYRAFQVVRLTHEAHRTVQSGFGPPVAQSRSSIVCTTGTDVPPAICTMHPILPAAIMSGRTVAMLATFRSRNLFAMSGWRML